MEQLDLLKRVEALEAKAAVAIPGAGGWTPPGWAAPVVGCAVAGVTTAAPFLVQAGHLAIAAVSSAVVLSLAGWLGVKSAGARKEGGA